MIDDLLEQSQLLEVGHDALARVVAIEANVRQWDQLVFVIGVIADGGIDRKDIDQAAM